MLTIRPFTGSDADYAALAAIVSAVWPDRAASIPTLRHFDHCHGNGYFFQRFVSEQGYSLVGYCEYGEPADSYRPGKYYCDVAVLPGCEGNGIGGALYDYMLTELRQRPVAATTIVAKTRADKPQAIRFLTKRGFELIMRSLRAGLAVDRFDPTPFAQRIPEVKSRGIELVSLAELARANPNWQQQVYELDWECTLDEPLPDTPTKPAFEHYAAEIFGNPDFQPEAWFIAVDQGRYVGIAAANRNSQHPNQLDTFFTGIVRSHRRRGIALALKLLLIDYAKNNGYSCIVTDNEEHNPMYQINLKLGFEPEPALLFFQKRL
jgi:mycothiol synthase